MCKITEENIVKETKTRLYHEDGSYSSKCGEHHSYYETYEAAKSALILRMEDNVVAYKSKLAHAENKLAKAKEL